MGQTGVCKKHQLSIIWVSEKACKAVDVAVCFDTKTHCRVFSLKKTPGHSQQASTEYSQLNCAVNSYLY